MACEDIVMSLLNMYLNVLLLIAKSTKIINDQK